MKKLIISLTLVLAIFVACLIGCQPVGGDDTGVPSKEESAAAIFTMDVNPGVRIYVDDDNTVIFVEATNEDGEEIVAELDLEGLDYETVIEEIINKLEESGYLEGDENAILISVEKKVKDISDKVNEKINEAFEKHGKKASVIEQELDKLGKEVDKAIDDMSEKYHISKGKAHLIEKIREEFPELSEEELASLTVNDLRMMLEETSEDIKKHFKHIGKVIEDAYVGREQALTAALEALEVAMDDVTMLRVRVTRGEGKMLYEVRFVYNEMEYEITVDAITGEILATDSKEFVEFDAKGFIDDFCNKHNIDIGDLKDKIFNELFGKPNTDHSGEETLTRGQLLESILTLLNISEEMLEKTDVEIHRTESGTIYSVMIESKEGDVYKLLVEAYSGVVLKAELNGVVFEITANNAQ